MGVENRGDERSVAKEALEESKENAREMVQSYSGAFVAVERRGLTFQSSLAGLLCRLEDSAAINVERLHRELSENQEKTSQASCDISHDDVQLDENITGAAKALKEHTSRHRLRRRTLLQHSSLTELLELANVMDACIRSQLYEDALHIASFANTLERRHYSNRKNVSGPVSTSKGQLVITNVIDEIRAREVELRHFLLQQFKSDLTMSRCLELVTALRHLNGIELERMRFQAGEDFFDAEGLHLAMELRLQVQFLEARDKWLEKAEASSFTDLSNVTSTIQCEKILNWIERHRTRCFEIVSQFSSIFCGVDDMAIMNRGAALVEQSPESLLSIWCTRRVQLFLRSLNQELQHTKIDSLNISSDVVGTKSVNTIGVTTMPTIASLPILHDVMDASVFFATSLQRMGFDFSTLVLDMMEKCTVTVVLQSWHEGLNAFNETLRLCREAGVADFLINKTVSEEDADHLIGTFVAAGESQASIMYPPRCLVAFPPIARLANTFVASFNDLRRFLLPGIFDLLNHRLLNDIFPELDKILEENEVEVTTPRMHGDALNLRTVASEYKKIASQVLKPFILQALDVAIGRLGPDIDGILNESVIVADQSENDNYS